jgi:fluoroquinolone resistance protein
MWRSIAKRRLPGKRRPREAGVGYLRRLAGRLAPTRILLGIGGVATILGLPLVVVDASTGMTVLGSVLLSVGGAALIASITLASSARLARAEREERRYSESKAVAARLQSNRNHRDQHFGDTYLVHPVEVTKHNFSSATLERAIWKDAILTGSNFEKARFDNAQLLNCVGSKGNFQDARFAGARISGLFSFADFGGAEFQFADLRNAFLDNSSFASKPGRTTYLRETRFSGSGGLDSVNFTRCECEGADFSDTRLYNPRFDQAFLADARFDGATICASFVGAMFAGQQGDRPATFGNAEILGVLPRASADFSEAWIVNVDFSTVENLEYANFKNAVASAGTVFPDDFDPVGQGVLMLHELSGDDLHAAIIGWEDRHGRPAGWVA